MARRAGAIEAALTPTTRVLILNTPHNPTGRVLDRSELDLLAEVAREHDLTVITDEVYEHLVFDGEHIAAATLPGMGARTLTISSIGKSYGLTGWKTGWATGPAELVARVRAVKQFLTFGGHAAAACERGGAATARRAAARGGRDAPRQARPARRGTHRRGFEVLPTAGTYFSRSTPPQIPAPAMPRALPAAAARGGGRRDPDVGVHGRS